MSSEQQSTGKRAHESSVEKAISAANDDSNTEHCEAAVPKRQRNSADAERPSSHVHSASECESIEARQAARRVMYVDSDGEVDDADGEADDTSGAATTSISQIRAALGLSRQDDGDNVSVASLTSVMANPETLPCNDDQETDTVSQEISPEGTTDAAMQENVRLTVTCAVCLQLLTRPVALSSCGHSFCRV
jgi:hypothetical protein